MIIYFFINKAEAADLAFLLCNELRLIHFLIIYQLNYMIKVLIIPISLSSIYYRE